MVEAGPGGCWPHPPGLGSRDAPKNEKLLLYTTTCTVNEVTSGSYFSLMCVPSSSCILETALVKGDDVSYNTDTTYCVIKHSNSLLSSKRTL